MEKEFILKVITELASTLTSSDAHKTDGDVIEAAAELWNLANALKLEFKYFKK